MDAGAGRPRVGWVIGSALVLGGLVALGVGYVWLMLA
jgi:hypothetical protein